MRPWMGMRDPLTPGAFGRAARLLKIDEDLVKAVWDEESGGRFWDKDGGVIRRFEPHKLPKWLQEQIGFEDQDDDGDIDWRDSTKIKESERARLFALAYEIDPNAALEATSWGGAQILGSNCRLAGYRSAEEMVQRFADSEDEHLYAFVAFCRAKKADERLQEGDFVGFATIYNGPGKAQEYANKIQRSYNKRADGFLPMLRMGNQGRTVTDLQSRLVDLGYTLGETDGKFGRATRAAVLAFQADNRLETDGVVGRKTWQALENAPTKPVSAGRRTATLEEVREVSTTAKQSEIGKRSIEVAAGGLVVNQMSEAVSYMDMAMPMIDKVKLMLSENWQVILILIVLFIAYRGFKKIEMERWRKYIFGQDMTK